MPYLDFQVNQVLTAAQVNTFLMNQAVMRFADSAARSSALGTAVAEGMVSYLDDTDALEVYNGTAWVGGGDITAVTAGTALTGGGTGGDVTLDVDLDAVFANPLANFVTDATTARTVTSADQGKTIRFTSASATTVTVDLSTDFEVGARVDIIADGAGALTVTASGATVAAAETSTTSGSFTIGLQYSAATLLCVATDEYRLIGNVAVE